MSTGDEGDLGADIKRAELKLVASNGKATDDTKPGRKRGAKGGDGEEDGPKLTQRDLLVAIALQGVTYWHDPDHNAYATIEVDGHQESHPVKSQAFKRHLVGIFADTYTIEVNGERIGRAPSATAIGEARDLLEARAMRGELHRPGQRVGATGDKLYLDLGGPEWKAIEIDAEGWRIVAQPSCKMVRRGGLRQLGEPVRGGSVDELRDVLNFGEEDGQAEADRRFKLFVGFLLSTFLPEGSFPILAVSGEHGSGKSTLTSYAKQLVDPHEAERRTTPVVVDDLYTQARHTHVLLFDNVSTIQPWLSDELAKVATGGAHGRRTRYTDTDETYMRVRNPVILNGIPDLATRPDLADRCITMHLPAMRRGARRDERQLLADMAYTAPRVLGALLDGVSSALRRRDEVREALHERPDQPRMLDAAIWIEAAGSAFGWRPWEFFDAYMENRRQATARAIEGDAVAQAVLRLVQGEGPFRGTGTALLAAIGRSPNSSEDERKRKGWPTQANHFAGKLRRLAPALRDLGLNVVELGEDPKKRVMIWSIDPVSGEE